MKHTLAIFRWGVLLLSSAVLLACEKNDPPSGTGGKGHFKVSVNGEQQWENDIIHAFYRPLPDGSGYTLVIISKKTADEAVPNFNLTYISPSEPETGTLTLPDANDAGSAGYHTDGSIPGYYNLEEGGSITVSISKTTVAAAGTVILIAGTFSGNLVNQDDEVIAISGSFDDKAYPDYD